MRKRTNLEIRSQKNVLDMIDKGYLIVGKHYYYKNLMHKDIRVNHEYNKCNVELLESGEWGIKKFDNSGDTYVSTSISGLANKLYKEFAPWVMRRISENGWKKVYFKSGPYKDKPLNIVYKFYWEEMERERVARVAEFEKKKKKAELEKKKKKAELEKKKKEHLVEPESARRIQMLKMMEEERKIFLRMKRRELKMIEREALHKKIMTELRDDIESSDDEGAFD